MSKHIHAECITLSVWYKAAGGYSLTRKISWVNFIQNKKDGKDIIWQDNETGCCKNEQNCSLEKP